MTPSLYVLDALLWSLAGFITGYVMNEVVLIAYTKFGRRDRSDDVYVRETRVREILIVSLVGLGLLTVLYAMRTNVVETRNAIEQRKAAEEAQATVECQAKFNASLLDGLLAQSRAFSESARDLRTKFKAVQIAMEDGTSAEAAEAMTAYVEAAQRHEALQEKVRELHARAPKCVRRELRNE